MELTLDNNCFIALEQHEEPAATALRGLITAHEAGKVRLRVVCVSGFERLRGEDRIPYIEEFDVRLERIGLKGVQILPSIAYSDAGFRLDSGFIVGSDDDFTFEQHIHRTLFPNDGDGTWDSYTAAHNTWDYERRVKAWKNHKRDVLTLWSHIRYGGNLFVTTDRNFLRAKKQALVGLGAGAIMRPDEALRHLYEQKTVQ